MKRYLFILLFFVAPFNGMAADLLDNLIAIRTFVKSELGYDSAASGPIIDARIDQLIRVSVVVINPLIEGNTIIDSNQTLSVNVNRYEIDSTMINIISVEMKSRDSVKALVYVPRELWHQQQRTETTPKSPWPSNYDYTDDDVFVFPTPKFARTNRDTLMIIGVRKVLNIMIDDSLDVELKLIPQKYRYVIAEYAIYRVARAIRDPLLQVIRQDLIDAARAVNVLFNRQDKFVVQGN